MYLHHLIKSSNRQASVITGAWDVDTAGHVFSRFALPAAGAEGGRDALGQRIGRGLWLRSRWNDRTGCSAKGSTGPCGRRPQGCGTAWRDALDGGTASGHDGENVARTSSGVNSGYSGSDRSPSPLAIRCIRSAGNGRNSLAAVSVSVVSQSS